MPVSGLSIRLLHDRARSALDALRAHPALEVGAVHGDRAAVVAETMSEDESRDVWRWLSSLHGVVAVDVVYVHFDEMTEREDEAHTEVV